VDTTLLARTAEALAAKFGKTVSDMDNSASSVY
ncbi:4-hydroxy-2-oxo-heptane-1,7-dioate aldolase, partial [Providencia rettgeri]